MANVCFSICLLDGCTAQCNVFVNTFSRYKSSADRNGERERERVQFRWGELSNSLQMFMGSRYAWNASVECVFSCPYTSNGVLYGQILAVDCKLPLIKRTMSSVYTKMIASRYRHTFIRLYLYDSGDEYSPHMLRKARHYSQTVNSYRSCSPTFGLARICLIILSDLCNPIRMNGICGVYLLLCVCVLYSINMSS